MQLRLAFAHKGKDVEEEDLSLSPTGPHTTPTSVITRKLKPVDSKRNVLTTQADARFVLVDFHLYLFSKVTVVHPM